MRRIGKHNQDGFTLIELMIALSVLSTILVISTVIMIQIGALYTKGVNAAALQNADRTVVADISAALQFSGNAPVASTTNINTPIGTIQAYCIGTTRYSYLMDRELGTDNFAVPVADTRHVLWRDTMSNANNACRPMDISKSNPSNPTGNPQSPSVNGSGYEMTAAHMRLRNFSICQAAGCGIGGSSNVYGINVWMAYGDSDLLVNRAGKHTACKGNNATQFCSISEISTTVAGRAY